MEMDSPTTLHRLRNTVLSGAIWSILVLLVCSATTSLYAQSPFASSKQSILLSNAQSGASERWAAIFFPSTATANYRLILPNIAPTVGQVLNIASVSGNDATLQWADISGSAWSLSGNTPTASWNGTTGSFLGTTNAQPLSIATTNAIAQDIRFFTGANGAIERMRISGTGNVGIGTTSPTYLLDIFGGMLRVGATSTNNDSYLLLNSDGAGFYNFVQFSNAGTIYGGFQGHKSVGLFSNFNNHIFRDANGNEFLRIASSGSVGIGSNSPTQRLHVAGNILVDTVSSSTAGRILFNNPARTFTSSFRAGAQSANIDYTLPTVAPTAGQVLSSDASGNMSWSTALTGASGWALSGNTPTASWNGTTGSFLGTTNAQPLSIATTNATAQDIRFFTGANGAIERMRILSTGEIGIGTTTPASLFPLSIQAQNNVNGEGLRLIGGNTSRTLSINVGNAGNSSITTSGSDLNLTSAYRLNLTAIGGAWSNPFVFSTSTPMTQTTGGVQMAMFQGTWAPTSGSNKFTGLYIEPVISQTGTANGDWTALEVNAGISTSTATNALLAEFRTGSTQRFAFTASGRQGIGLNNPTHALHINAGANPLRLEGVQTSSQDTVLVIDATGVVTRRAASLLVAGSSWSLNGNTPTASWNGTTGSFLGTTNAQPLSIATTNATAQDIRFFTGANGANERMAITAAGNVGIGVTTPTQMLEVGTGSNVSAVIGNAFIGKGTDGGYGGWAYFGHVTNPSSSGGSVAIHSSGGTVLNGQYMAFRIGNGNRMYLGNNGFVGVGDNLTNPSQRFHLRDGNFLLDTVGSNTASQLQFRNPSGTFQTNIQAGAQTANLTYTLPTTAPTAGQVLSSDASGNMSWSTALTGTSGWSLSGNTPTASWNGTTGSFLGTTNAQPLSIATTNATAQDIRFFTGVNGSSERMRITGTGSVGIGTSSPVSTFHVAGGSTGVLVTIDGAGSGSYSAATLYRSNLSGGRGLGMALLDSASKTEWWVGRPYFGGMSNSSDNFVVFRKSGLNYHDGYSAMIRDGSNNPTGTAALLVLNNSGNLGLGGVTSPSQRLHIAGNLLIDTSTASTAGQLQLMNPARTFQTNLRAGAQTANLTYTLPTTAPTAGQVLSSDASGNMSWSTALTGTSGWALSGNAPTATWNGTTGSFLGTTNAQPLSIATTNATAQDILFFTGANGSSERMRILGNGNVGIGTNAPVELLDVAGDMRLTNQRTRSMQRTIPTTVGQAVDIGTFTLTQGGGSFWISITAPNGNFSMAKQYVIPIGWNQTGGSWFVAQPIQSTGQSFGNDYELDVLSSGASFSLRLRRTLGTTAGTAFIVIKQEGVNTDAFTASTTVNTVTAPTSTLYGATITSWQLLGNAPTASWNGSTGSFLGTTSAQPLSIATTNATAQDITFFTGANGASERMRILGNGNVGIGTNAPAELLDVAGDLRINNMRTRTMQRTIPTTVGQAVDIGSFALTNGTGSFWISVTIPSPSFAVSKQYLIPISWNQTNNVWFIAQPSQSTGGYGGNDVELEVNSSSGTFSLRLRRSAGTTAGTAYVVIKQEGLNTDTFTPSTIVNTVTAPISTLYASSGWSTSGNSITGTEFIGTTNSQPLFMRSGNTDVLQLNTNGSIQRGTSGNARGTAAIDLQLNASGLNVASGNASFIGSGDGNRASGLRSVTVGGFSNITSGDYGATVGGTSNNNQPSNGFIGGGSSNTIGSSASSAVIAGGESNSATGSASFIGGGSNNTASGLRAVIAGGFYNTNSAGYGFIGSGANDTISNGNYGVIVAGSFNKVSTSSGGILSGDNNTVSGNQAIVGAGTLNTASGMESGVFTGRRNVANGMFTSIVGGHGLTLADNSFGFSAWTSDANRPNISTTNTAYFGDVNLWIGNVNNTARELRFYEANTSLTYTGTNYTAFKAGTQSANITYTLPTTAPTAGQVLSSDASGNMSWTTSSSTTSLSSITAATATNSINSSNFGQTWQWNTLAGTSALTLSTTSTAAASDAQTLLNLSMSGANTTSTQTTFGAQISNTHTGTGSTNVGLSVSASGGTNNYGLLVPNGSVGIGTTTPGYNLEVNGATIYFRNGATPYFYAAGGPNVGIAMSSTPNSPLTVGGGTSIGYNLSAPTNGLIVLGNTGIGVSSPTARLQVNGTSRFSGGNMLIDTSAVNTAGQLQLMNPARTFQTNLRAGVQTANITYTLPTTAPTAGQVLSSDASGNMSWVTGLTSATVWTTTGNTGTVSSTNFLGTTDAQDLTIRVNNTERLSVRQASGYLHLNQINQNTMMGYQVANASPTGGANTGLGYQSLFNLSSGSSNVAIGFVSMSQNQTGSHNTAVGTVALNLITGSFNVGVGSWSGYWMTGNKNTVLGYNAGFNHTSGDQNIFIGDSSRHPSGSTGSNLMSIGNAIFGNGINTTNPRIGIGAISFASDVTLDVRGNTAISNSDNLAKELRFYEPSNSGLNYSSLRAGIQAANITYTLPTTAPTAGQVLSSDASGNMSWVANGSGSGWSTTGNASTSPSTNYLGTSDAQDLVIRTNAIERARFANGNTLNFGIQGSGATIPPASFTIGSAGWVSSSTSNNQAGTHTIIQAGPGTGIGSPGYISMRVPATGSSGTAVQSSSEMMRINGTGVLIGGASGTMPNYRLQVDANSGGQAYANFTTGSGSGTASSDGLIVGLQNDNTNALVWNQENGYVRFGTNNAERVRIDNAGNVGIGVTSPTYRLDVSGGDFRLVNNSSYLRTWGESDIEYDGGADGLMAFRNNANSNGKTRFWNASSTHLLTIQNNGNIGINTDSPSQMLHTMNGNILIDNNDNTARELRFDEPSGSGTNYTAFRAQAQSADITYTLPAASPASNGSILTSTTGGTMSWTDPTTTVGGTDIVYKASSETVTSSTTLQNDDHLFMAIGANEVWQYEFVVHVTGNPGSIKFAITHPAGASMRFGCLMDNELSEDEYEHINVSGTATTTWFNIVDAGTIFVIKGLVVNSTTAGNVRLQWAQNSSNGTGTSVLNLSYLKGHRVQ